MVLCLACLALAVEIDGLRRKLLLAGALVFAGAQIGQWL